VKRTEALSLGFSVDVFGYDVFGSDLSAGRGGYLLENGDKPADSKCQPHNKISCFNDSGIGWVPGWGPGSSLWVLGSRWISGESENVEILAARKSIGIPIKRHRKYYRGHLQPCSSVLFGSIVLSINFHTWHFFVMLIRPPSWCWNPIGHLKYLL